jgi:hypothetical protein
MSLGSEQRPGLTARLAAWLRDRWQREHERREMAQMGARDFGDIAVSPGLMREETRRWPGQKSNPGWSAVDERRAEDTDGASLEHHAVTTGADRSTADTVALRGSAAVRLLRDPI